MDLFAAGFNAWDQLSFNHHVSTKEEPHDLHRFTKVLSATVIERPVSRLTYTIVRQDGCLVVAGIGPKTEDVEFLYTSAETASGELLTIVHDDQDGGDDSNKLVKHSSLSSRRAGSGPESVFPCTPPATQIAAFSTGFVILHSDGSVSTFGDSRFEDCLGRDIDTPNRPSDEPGPVPDLQDITSADDPVKHVTAGGTAVAALTSTSGSIYVWGSTLSSANYTEVDDGKDVVDVALGEAHAIALTVDGLIYVIGENNNGQLGLGGDVETVETWTNVPFKAADGYKIVGVAAGPRTSFILTAKT